MRAINKLTDSKCKNAEIKNKSYKLSDGRGLYLCVLNTGGKSWRFNYKFNNVSKTITFGLFPDLTVKDARDKLNEARHQLALGVDPLEERKNKTTHYNSKYNFKKIALEFRQTKQDKAKGTQDALDIMLNKHILPVLGQYNINQLQLSELKKFILTYLVNNKYTLAERIIIVINQIYKYAKLQEYCDHNNASLLYDFIKPYKNKQKKEYPALTEIKDVKIMIKQIYKLQCNNKNISLPVMYCAVMLPFTAQRAQELYKACWQDIDFDKQLLNVPAENVKTRKSYILPLTKKLLEWFQFIFFCRFLHRYYDLFRLMMKVYPQEKQYIFQRKGQNKPVTCATIRKVMYSAGIEQGKMCLHGWRKVFSTIAHNEGVPSYLIESILNHSIGNRIELTYNKANYLESKREVLQWWEDYLFALIYNKEVLPKINQYIDNFGQPIYDSTVMNNKR